MKLEYKSTISDVAELHTRLFLRSKTFEKQRLYSSLTCMAIVVGGVYYFTQGPQSTTYWILAVLFAFLLAAVVFVAYRRIISERIAKYIVREYGENLPAVTEYVLEQRQLTCRSLGVDTSFSLDDVESVCEVEGYVEVTFGYRGLCTIPLRAFDSESHKSMFLSAIKMEQVGIP